MLKRKCGLQFLFLSALVRKINILDLDMRKHQQISVQVSIHLQMDDTCGSENKHQSIQQKDV